MGFLMRRGYSSSLVLRVMRDLVKAYGAANEEDMDFSEGSFEEF